MKTIIAIACFLLSIHAACAQSTTCEVLVDSLKGTYEGGCKKGKADGEGKASGLDKYEGSFKNGLPDGTGTYTWKNGNWYTGSWKKGLKEGKGELYIKVSDNSVKGFWKKNTYKGEYEKPYEIVNLSNKVSHNDFANLDSTGTTVTVVMESGLFSQADVDDFQVMLGSYQKHNKRETGAKNRSIEFQDVQFPFKLRFGLGGSPFEFIIFEKGQWLVNIHL